MQQGKKLRRDPGMGTYLGSCRERMSRRESRREECFFGAPKNTYSYIYVCRSVRGFWSTGMQCTDTTMLTQSKDKMGLLHECAMELMTWYEAHHAAQGRRNSFSQPSQRPGRLVPRHKSRREATVADVTFGHVCRVGPFATRPKGWTGIRTAEQRRRKSVSQTVIRRIVPKSRGVYHQKSWRFLFSSKIL